MTDRVPAIVIPLPSRENIEAKGRRYLLEGRLHVLAVHHERIYAECRGSDATYHLGWTRGKWWCHCDARGRCSHLVALTLVVTAPTGIPS